MSSNLPRDFAMSHGQKSQHLLDFFHFVSRQLFDTTNADVDDTNGDALSVPNGNCDVTLAIGICSNGLWAFSALKEVVPAGKRNKYRKTVLVLFKTVYVDFTGNFSILTNAIEWIDLRISCPKLFCTILRWVVYPIACFRMRKLAKRIACGNSSLPALYIVGTLASF